MGKQITIDRAMLVNELMDTAPIDGKGNRWLTPFKSEKHAKVYLKDKINDCEVKKQPDLEGKLVYHKGGKMYEIVDSICDDCKLEDRAKRFDICISDDVVSGLSCFKEIKGECNG